MTVEMTKISGLRTLRSDLFRNYNGTDEVPGIPVRLVVQLGILDPRLLHPMKGAMSRNLYLLAASLLLFSLISCGMSLVPNSLQPGLPVNGSLWKTIGLVFLLTSLLSALAGILTAMFEQVERRSEERMRRELQEGLARLGRNKAPQVNQLQSVR